MLLLPTQLLCGEPTPLKRRSLHRKSLALLELVPQFLLVLLAQLMDAEAPAEDACDLCSKVVCSCRGRC